jgi:uncharacterized protein with HEPN domain
VCSRSWQARVQDILSSIASIQQRIEGLLFDDFLTNETIIKAVFYDFIIIGEAARNIPADLQARYPEIPWRLMADMRNVIAHEYFQVDAERVWRTIQNDLHALAPLLNTMFERELDNES